MRRAAPAAAALAAAFAVALAALPALAQAGAAQAAAAPVFDLANWLRSTFGPVAATLLIAGAPIAAFLGKWAFDEVKAANAKRRDFVQKTTEKVVDLAWGHYWGLANATGTLAGALTNHLRMVDAHLLVAWDAPSSLRERLREIAAETARGSFPSFVRLLYAFERFQFRGSNTYLLPHHAAGETLRRLYNRFVESLGTDMVALLLDIRLAIERKTARSDQPPDLGSAQFEMDEWFTVAPGCGAGAGAAKRTAASDLPDAALAARLDQARERYRAWLDTQPAAVAEAADSLRAFSRLLTHELAALHAVWHRDRGPFAVTETWRQARGAVAAGAWPGVLDDSAVETIRRARPVSPFFAPLGLGQKPQAPRREESVEAEAPQADALAPAGQARPPAQPAAGP